MNAQVTTSVPCYPPNPWWCFTSLHFTLRDLWRELCFQKLNPFIPRPFPAECYPLKIVFIPPGVDAVQPPKNTRPKIPRRGGRHEACRATSALGIMGGSVYRKNAQVPRSVRPAGLTDPGPTPVYEDYVLDCLCQFEYLCRVSHGEKGTASRPVLSNASRSHSWSCAKCNFCSQSPS